MGIINLIRVLITRWKSFPELEWLDIQLMSDDLIDADDLIEDELVELVNSGFFSYIPSAFPSLKKLRLCGESLMGEVSHQRMKGFFKNLQTPLVSLCKNFWYYIPLLTTVERTSCPLC